MFLDIRNNVLTYQNGDKTIIKTITEEDVSRIKEAATSNTLTEELLLTICGDNNDKYVDNDLFFRKGRSLYMRGVDNISIPESLVEKMYPNPPKNLINFWKWAALNPNPVARDGLFWFLDTHDFEITDEGYFVGYRNVKKVRDGLYTDMHSQTFNIRVGESVTMSRDLCDSNPDNSCSAGLA